MPRRPFTRDQSYLLPPALDDWVPADHPIRFVALFVDELSPAEWEEMGIQLAGEHRGAPAYDARVLLSIWLAGVMDGIRSCRGLEAACRDKITFRWLTGNQLPDHNTLWRFYAAHRAGIKLLLDNTVKIAVRMGLVDLALLAVDGTKVAGNASRERTVKTTDLDALLARTEAVMAELDAAHAAAGDEGAPRLPAELHNKEHLRERILAAQQQVTEAGTPEQVNLTDPDARMQKARQGYVMGYNAQAAVVRADLGPDVPGGLLLAAVDVARAQDDRQHLLPMLAAGETHLGAAPEVLAADGGYYSAAALAGCAAQEQVVVMPETQSPAMTANPYHVGAFTYDAAGDTFTCPHGQPLTLRSERQRDGAPHARRYQASAAICRACPAYGVCTTDQRQGRSIEVSLHHAALLQHRAWMQTEEARAVSARRKTLVEPVFGIIKERLRLTRFHLRGLNNVRAEWNLLAVGFNLRTLARAWVAGLVPGFGGGGPSGQGRQATNRCAGEQHDTIDSALHAVFHCTSRVVRRHFAVAA